LTIGLPEFGAGNGGGSFRRIVQTPGGIAIAYDVGQGQGWQRSIVTNGSPHLPATFASGRRSRGDWRAILLVIGRDQLQSKTDYRGSPREPAPGRALDADQSDYARICRDH